MIQAPECFRSSLELSHASLCTSVFHSPLLRQSAFVHFLVLWKKLWTPTALMFDVLASATQTETVPNFSLPNPELPSKGALRGLSLGWAPTCEPVNYVKGLGSFLQSPECH